MKKAEIKQKFKELIATRNFKKACGITLCVLAFLVVFRLFLLVFPIRSFEIAGDTKYTVSDIITASKLKSGKPLYGINESKAKKNILKQCPYVKSVKIKQKFPGTVCFEIEEGEPGWYIQVGDNFYALDYDLKVVLESYSDQDMKLRGLTKLELPELQSVIVGEVPSFGNGDELLISETLKIIDAVRNHEIKGEMTHLDLKNRFQIKLTINETFDVDFGEMKDAGTKFNAIEALVEKKKQEGNAGGTITFVTDEPRTPFFKGDFEEDAHNADSQEDNLDE